VSNDTILTPAQFTAERPKSISEKIGAALPIALTALATAFAGMSTSELQRAMFWRSYAAQDQAKATSQWTLAGFKRDRSLICETTAIQLRAPAGNPRNPFLEQGGPGSEPAVTAIAWLAGNGPPNARLPEVKDEPLVKLLADIQARVSEAELLSQAGKISKETINAAIDNAEKEVERIDKLWGPITAHAVKLAATGDKDGAVARQTAGLELEERRYRAEASLNQGIGYLYEARVKVSSAESDKHQRKSQNYFYAMLSAQIGATLAALAMARKQKSVLWAVAGCTGIIALAIGAVVYLSEG
jgi:hypothetical protein